MWTRFPAPTGIPGDVAVESIFRAASRESQPWRVSQLSIRYVRCCAFPVGPGDRCGRRSRPDRQRTVSGRRGRRRACHRRRCERESASEGHRCQAQCGSAHPVLGSSEEDHKRGLLLRFWPLDALVQAPVHLADLQMLVSRHSSARGDPSLRPVLGLEARKCYRQSYRHSAEGSRVLRAPAPGAAGRG